MPRSAGWGWRRRSFGCLVVLLPRSARPTLVRRSFFIAMTGIALKLDEVWSGWEHPKAHATNQPRSARRRGTQPQAAQGSRQVA